jgi:hypothetical protein
MAQFVFDALSFLVAHIFFVPLVVGLAEWAAVARWGWLAGVPLLVLNLAYATTYCDRATHTGRRFWPGFAPFWLGCHPYFPVRTLMWDGSKFADSPSDVSRSGGWWGAGGGGGEGGDGT